MKSTFIRIALVLGAVSLATTSQVLAQDKASHRHMGHVLDGWRDTPESKGLLPAASDEAAVAAQHAGLALRNIEDLASIQRHIGHVLHAIDPTAAAGGPGKGYGLVKAAQGAAQHITLAAASDDASDNVKLHAEHASTSANNVVGWAQQIAELAEMVGAAESASRAAELAQEIKMLCDAITDGRDANADGRVGWGEGEGGLAQAVRHMDLMKRGEGM